MIARKITGPVLFEETNSYFYLALILAHFFKELAEGEKISGYFMKDGATAHTANFCVSVLQKVCGERLMTVGLWFQRSPDLNPCDCYSWKTLREFM